MFPDGGHGELTLRRGHSLSLTEKKKVRTHAEGVQIRGTRGQHKCGAGCFCTFLLPERLGELYRERWVVMPARLSQM